MCNLDNNVKFKIKHDLSNAKNENSKNLNTCLISSSSADYCVTLSASFIFTREFESNAQADGYGAYYK